MTRIADHALAVVAALLITSAVFHQAVTVPASAPAMASVAQGIDTVLTA